MPGFEFYSFESISSTNDKAREFAGKGMYNLVITAKKQEKGKGRFGREWSSDIGGLYMTIVLNEKDLEKIRHLTLIASIAVARSIKTLSKLDAKVKWPNDVMVNDKKACGILTEIIHGKENYALVGIGVNVNTDKFSNSLQEKATSLKIESKKAFDIGKLSRLIIKNFSSLYKNYQNKNYKKIIYSWKKLSHTLGEKIRAKTLSGEFVGKAIGIDEDCNLIMRLENGKTRRIIEADIFVV